MRFDERCIRRKGDIRDYARTLTTADQFTEPQRGPAGKTTNSLPPRGALIFGSPSRPSGILDPGSFRKDDSLGLTRGPNHGDMRQLFGNFYHPSSAS